MNSKLLLYSVFFGLLFVGTQMQAPSDGGKRSTKTHKRNPDETLEQKTARRAAKKERRARRNASNPQESSFNEPDFLETNPNGNVSDGNNPLTSDSEVENGGIHDRKWTDKTDQDGMDKDKTPKQQLKNPEPSKSCFRRCCCKPLMFATCAVGIAYIVYRLALHFYNEKNEQQAEPTTTSTTDQEPAPETTSVEA